MYVRSFTSAAIERAIALANICTTYVRTLGSDVVHMSTIGCSGSCQYVCETVL